MLALPNTFVNRKYKNILNIFYIYKYMYSNLENDLSR